jgi:hypothetical protein
MEAGGRPRRRAFRGEAPLSASRSLSPLSPLRPNHHHPSNLNQLQRLIVSPKRYVAVRTCVTRRLSCNRKARRDKEKPREGFGSPRGKSERLAPVGYYSQCTDFVGSGAARRQ